MRIFICLLLVGFNFTPTEQLNLKEFYLSGLNEAELVNKKQTRALLRNDSFNGWDFYLTMPGNKISKRTFIQRFKDNHNLYSIQIYNKNFILDELACEACGDNRSIKLYYFNNGDLRSDAVLVGVYENVLLTTTLETVSKLTFSSFDSLKVETASLTFSDIIDNGKTSYYSNTITTYFNFMNDQIGQLSSDTLKYNWEE